jgi:hypothetical protein
MTRTLLSTLATLAAAGMAVAADEKKPEIQRPDFNSTYGVLSERNMFLRERQAPRPPRTNTQPRVDTNSTQARERATVLRGVTIEDNELHAYLENTRNNEVIRVAPGDALVNGHVAEIAIDAIAYNADGRTTWVEIGRNLSGGRESLSPPVVDSGPATTGPAGPAASGGATPPVPNNVKPEGMSMEDWLKARRAQQRGGK